MYPGIITFLLTLIFLCACFSNLKPSLKKSILLAFAFRILLSIIFTDINHYDSQSYREIGQMALRRQPIYASYAYSRHPYLPFPLYFEAMSLLPEVYGIPQLLVLKFFFSLFDVGILVLVWKISGKDRQENAFLYAINPVSIAFAAIHGQFDTIPLFFLLLSLMLLIKNLKISAYFALACGILFKPWPVLFLPAYWKYRKSAWITLTLILPLICILIYSVIYREPFATVIRPLLSYRGSYGMWGLGVIIGKFLPPQTVNMTVIKILTNVSIIALIYFIFRFKNSNVISDIFLSILFIFVFFPSGGNAIWILPFIFIIRPQYWQIFIGAYGLYHAFGFFAANFPEAEIFLSASKILAFLIWLGHIYMLGKFVRLKGVESVKIVL